MTLIEEVAQYNLERVNLALSIIDHHRTCDPAQTLQEVEAALKGASIDEIEHMREEG